MLCLSVVNPTKNKMLGQSVAFFCQCCGSASTKCGSGSHKWEKCASDLDSDLNAWWFFWNQIIYQKKRFLRPKVHSKRVCHSLTIFFSNTIWNKGYRTLCNNKYLLNMFTFDIFSICLYFGWYLRNIAFHNFFLIKYKIFLC